MLQLPDISGKIRMDLNDLKKSFSEGAGDARAFSAEVEPDLNQAATLDIGDFSGGIESMLGGLEALVNPAALAGAAVAAIGAAAAGVAAFIFDATRDTIELGGSLHDMAINAGVGVETLSALGLVAKQSGADMATVADTFKFLGKNQAEAILGNKEAIAGFGRMGVEFADAAGKARPLEDVLFDVADALKAMPAGASRTEVAMQLMGRGGTQMIAMLTQGSASLREQMEVHKQLGAVITDEAANSADAFGDMLDDFESGWTGLKNTIGEPIIEALTPALIELRAWVIEHMPEIRDDIKIAIDTAIDAFQTAAPIVKALWDELVQVGSAFKLAGAAADQAWTELKIPFDIAAEIIAPLKDLAATVSGPLVGAFEMLNSAIAPLSGKLEKLHAILLAMDLINSGAVLGAVGTAVAGAGAGGGGAGAEGSTLMSKPIAGMGGEAQNKFFDRQAAIPVNDFFDAQAAGPFVDDALDAFFGPLEEAAAARAAAAGPRVDDALDRFFDPIEKAGDKMLARVDDALDRFFEPVEKEDKKPFTKQKLTDEQPKFAEFLRADSADAFRFTSGQSTDPNDIPKKQLSVAQVHTRLLGDIKDRLKFTVG